MERKGRYYLSRVIKAGQLNSETLIRAISNPATIDFIGNSDMIGEC